MPRRPTTTKAPPPKASPPPKVQAIAVVDVQPVNTPPPAPHVCMTCPILRGERDNLRFVLAEVKAQLALFEKNEPMEDMIERQLRYLLQEVAASDGEYRFLNLGKALETAVKYYSAKHRAAPAAESSEWGSALNGGKR